MSEQTKAVFAYLSDAIAKVNEATAQIQHALDVLVVMNGGGAQPQKRLIFCSPVTGKIELLNAFGADWFDATGYATYYTASGAPAYHTGCDLNRPNFMDANAPIYAAADGDVVFGGEVKGWQGEVVVIRHKLESGELVWTRYAHIALTHAALNSTVKRGDYIGNIADYNRNGPTGDHLHFDVAHVDLGEKPGDWPGMDIERLKRDYIDPDKWLRERQA